MIRRNNILLGLIVLIIISLIITGLMVDGVQAACRGFIDIQLTPARLISDFIETAGIGAALLNSAVVGICGLVVILTSKVKLSGPTFAAVLTLMGFALFGKTPVNIAPIIAGVYLSAKFVGKSFREYIIIALFGTALGPIVSFIAFEFGLTGGIATAAGIGIGIITGFILPSIAVSMLHLHQGYNLYNMGLSCGFFGLFAAAFILATGHEFHGNVSWYSESSLILTLLIPILSIIFIATGLIFGGKKAIKSFWAIQKIPGRLPSDFMDMESMEGTLINCGLIGLVGSAYIYLIGGDFNGPVIGGLLTVIGFGTFGTNLKNAWPVVFGVIISALVFGNQLSSPGPILAAIFVTTLAPLAGQFGAITGIIAGFIHLPMVMETGGWYGGMNLYNNGFAGGLTATFLVAIIQWYKTNRTEFRGKKGGKL